jgi:hypothetical protein
MARLDTEAPCPHCGAPSPLARSANNIFAQEAALPTVPWGDSTAEFSPSPYSNQTFAFPQQPFSDQASTCSQQPFGSQISQSLPETPQGQPQQPFDQQQRDAMLPAIYQPQAQQYMGLQAATYPMRGQEGGALMPLPGQDLGEFIATLPGGENLTYVEPMYTKPRVIIPRYRAISGLISVLIVAFLICGGVGYYAKASGKLSSFGQMYGLVPPPNVKPSPAAKLSNPPAAQVVGPAYTIINSATTTARLNAQHVAVESDTIFKAGQTIYLTYSVQKPKTPGIVTIKWYTNNIFFEQSPATPMISQAINGYTGVEYPESADGKVELYWNNQLALTLYFVVR